MNTQSLIHKRDQKAKLHLNQYAPVWLTSENIINKDEGIQFEVTFRHRDYGWVGRNYYYDSFNNTLYYRGQTATPEEEIIRLETKEPYINTLTANTPNSYGG